MTEARTESLVAVAFARTAEVISWHVTMSREEREDIERALRNLLDLGHLAGFSVRHTEGDTDEDLSDGLRSRIANATVDACFAATEASNGSAPTLLMPIWGFERVSGQPPVANGHLLGLDVELIASPSPDEELGAHLPGHPGRWFVHARPMF